MPRRLLLDLAVAATAGAGVAAAWCWRQGATPRLTDDPWTLAADAMLDAPVADVSFAGSGDEAMDLLPIVYKSQPDAWGDRSGDATVILRLRGATLRQALQALDGELHRGRLAWWYDAESEGIVVSAPQSGRYPSQIERVYDVGDILGDGRSLARRFRHFSQRYQPDPRTLRGQYVALSEFLTHAARTEDWTDEPRHRGGFFAADPEGILVRTAGAAEHRRVELVLAALRAKDDRHEDR